MSKNRLIGVLAFCAIASIATNVVVHQDNVALQAKNSELLADRLTYEEYDVAWKATKAKLTEARELAIQAERELQDMVGIFDEYEQCAAEGRAAGRAFAGVKCSYEKGLQTSPANGKLAEALVWSGDVATHRCELKRLDAALYQ